MRNAKIQLRAKHFDSTMYEPVARILDLCAKLTHGPRRNREVHGHLLYKSHKTHLVFK